MNMSGTLSRPGLVLVVLSGLVLSSPSLSREKQELGRVLDQTAGRLDSYPFYKNWTASVVSREYKMDKNWQPQEWTVVTKTVYHRNGRMEENIHKALETKKGVTKDVTSQRVEEELKRREKAAEREAGRKSEENQGGSKQTLEVSLADMFPFAAEKREKYEFVLLKDIVFNGRQAFLIEARMKEEFLNPAQNKENAGRSDVFWNGRYTIDAETYDILKLEAQPAKKQRFVKRLEMEMSFQVLERGHLALKASKTSIEAGFLLKHIRMIVEEEYTQVTVLDEPRS